MSRTIWHLLALFGYFLSSKVCNVAHLVECRPLRILLARLIGQGVYKLSRTPENRHYDFDYLVSVTDSKALGN